MEIEKRHCVDPRKIRKILVSELRLREWREGTD